MKDMNLKGKFSAAVHRIWDEIDQLPFNFEGECTLSISPENALQSLGDVAIDSDVAKNFLYSVAHCIEVKKTNPSYGRPGSLYDFFRVARACVNKDTHPDDYAEINSVLEEIENRARQSALPS